MVYFKLYLSVNYWLCAKYLFVPPPKINQFLDKTIPKINQLLFYLPFNYPSVAVYIIVPIDSSAKNHNIQQIWSPSCIVHDEYICLVN